MLPKTEFVGYEMHVLEPILFSRTNVRAKNRTLLAAMTNKQSLDDGRLSEDEIHWLVRRAKGGFGITTTAAANVTKTGRGWDGEMGVWGDHQLEGLSKLATQLKETGTISLVQLFHGGMRAPENLNGQQPISASKNTEVHMNRTYAREMSEMEIVSMIQSFTEAAVRCEKAGFHGVELHGAHSYLICQFLGSQTNRRTDSWGGDIWGRSRFLREIIHSIRKETNKDFLISVRISPIIESIGIALDESLALTKILCDLEIDMLHLSCWDVFQSIGAGSNLTKEFRRVVPEHVVFVSTGSVWSSQDVQWLLREGADVVGVARVGIGHPDWPMHLHTLDYNPQRPPFTVAHLSEAGLNPTFISYMKRWKNFVAEQ